MWYVLANHPISAGGAGGTSVRLLVISTVASAAAALLVAVTKPITVRPDEQACVV